MMHAYIDVTTTYSIYLQPADSMIGVHTSMHGVRMIYVQLDFIGVRMVMHAGGVCGSVRMMMHGSVRMTT